MSERAEDGGQAFPLVEWASPSGMVAKTVREGMTLRDYFAAHAISGVVQQCAQDSFRAVDTTPEEYFASKAYGIADAMLKRREA